MEPIPQRDLHYISAPKIETNHHIVINFPLGKKNTKPIYMYNSFLQEKFSAHIIVLPESLKKPKRY